MRLGWRRGANQSSGSCDAVSIEGRDSTGSTASGDSLGALAWRHSFLIRELSRFADFNHADGVKHCWRVPASNAEGLRVA